MGLLWMDSEREELDRDSALLAGALRETPARVAEAGSEDFAAPGRLVWEVEVYRKDDTGLGGWCPEE